MKVARVFQFFDSFLDQENIRPLKGIVLEWPGRRFLPVYEMGWAGMVASCEGVFLKKMIGQEISFRMRLLGESEPVLFKARILQEKNSLAYISVDSLKVENRIHIQQSSKDLLIANNWSEITTEKIKGAGISQWFHAPFDTNIVQYSDPEKGTVFEYDGVLLLNSPEGCKVRRSSSLLQGSSYADVWEKPTITPAGITSEWKTRVRNFAKNEQLRPWISSVAPEVGL